MSATSGNRIDSLDGLRGLAALIVVFTHSAGAFWQDKFVRASLHHSPAAALLNGDGAVNLFFVLSGYVLANSLARGSGTFDVGLFYVRRVFRIYPAYIAALLFAWLAFFAYGELAELPRPSSWILKARAVHLTGAQLFQSALFPSSAFGSMPVGWTLGIEMIYSLLLPVMYWTARRTHWGIVIVASLYALSGGQGGHPVQWYGFDFAVGIALYLERDRLANLAARIPQPAMFALIALGAIVFTYPEYAILGFRHPRATVAIYVVGSALLIFGALHSKPFERLLSSKPLRALGRISYGVYLLHITLISLLLPMALSQPNAVVQWLGFAFPLTLVTICTAWIFERWVEVPGIRAGRWISDALRGTKAGARH
jgi:peptidoglycan/LPS O-acetylase OafA/YrhL